MLHLYRSQKTTLSRYWLKCALLWAFCFWALPSYAQSPKVEVLGADEQQKTNILAWLGNLHEDCDLPLLRERSLLKRSSANVEKALQALGYYQADIGLKVVRQQDCWVLRVEVVANEPVTVTALDIQIMGEAAQDPTFAALIEQSPLQVGDSLRHDYYERLRNQLLGLLRDRGYFANQVLQQALLIDVAQRSAVVQLHVDSGQRFQFGAVVFEQEALRDHFLQKFVRFKQGDAYESQKLLELRQILSGSGYFTDVRVQPHWQPDELAVPITVSSQLRAKYVYTAGIGFATDTGPRLRMGLENRRVNSLGHRYNTGFEVSPIRSNIGFNYEIPIGDPNRERINLGSSATHEDIDDKLSDRYRLRAAYLREWQSGWIATHFLDWQAERFTIAGQRDKSYLLMPGYELTRIKADNPLYPRHGWKLNGMVRVAHEQMASSVSFAQFRGLAKWIFPTWQGRILTRIEGGATLADTVTELPTSVRFFAGGDSNVRGYAYQSLGPKNANGDVIGGRHLLAASVEYEFPFTEKWFGALFTDGGNAYDRLKDFKPVYANGIGVRWRSPIGPIRLDLAHPYSGSSRFRLHISMGMDL